MALILQRTMVKVQDMPYEKHVKWVVEHLCVQTSESLYFTLQAGASDTAVPGLSTLWCSILSPDFSASMVPLAADLLMALYCSTCVPSEIDRLKRVQLFVDIICTELREATSEIQTVVSWSARVHRHLSILQCVVSRFRIDTAPSSAGYLNAWQATAWNGTARDTVNAMATRVASQMEPEDGSPSVWVDVVHVVRTDAPQTGLRVVLNLTMTIGMVRRYILQLLSLPLDTNIVLQWGNITLLDDTQLIPLDCTRAVQDVLWVFPPAVVLDGTLTTAVNHQIATAWLSSPSAILVNATQHFSVLWHLLSPSSAVADSSSCDWTADRILIAKEASALIVLLPVPFCTFRQVFADTAIVDSWIDSSSPYCMEYSLRLIEALMHFGYPDVPSVTDDKIGKTGVWIEACNNHWYEMGSQWQNKFWEGVAWRKIASTVLSDTIECCLGDTSRSHLEPLVVMELQRLNDSCLLRQFSILNEFVVGHMAYVESTMVPLLFDTVPLWQQLQPASDLVSDLLECLFDDGISREVIDTSLLAPLPPLPELLMQCCKLLIRLGSQRVLSLVQQDQPATQQDTLVEHILNFVTAMLLYEPMRLWPVVYQSIALCPSSLPGGIVALLVTWYPVHRVRQYAAERFLILARAWSVSLAASTVSLMTDSDFSSPLRFFLNSLEETLRDFSLVRPLTLMLLC